MQLLLLQILPLLVVQLDLKWERDEEEEEEEEFVAQERKEEGCGWCAYIMVDEVQVVPWRDSHGVASSLLQLDVRLVECLVYVDKPVDDGLAMAGGHGQLGKDHGNMIWRDVLRGRKRKREGEKEVNTALNFGGRHLDARLRLTCPGPPCW